MTSFKDKIDKYNYEQLVAKCKKNAAIGKAIRLAAEENNGLVRYMLRDEKRCRATISRKYLWVLAFFRGRTLDNIEPKRNPDNELSKQDIIESIWWIARPEYGRYKRVYTAQFIEDINRFFGDEILAVEAPVKQENKSERLVAEAI